MSSISNNINKSKEFSEIYHRISEFYTQETRALVLHLREEHHYTYQKIADILGISKQRVQDRFFPKV